MKKLINVFILFCWVSAIGKTMTYEQQISNRIRYSASKGVMCAVKLKCSSALTARFYAKRGNKLAWVDQSGNLTSSGKNLVAAIDNATKDGFDPRVYHMRQIDKMAEMLQDVSDSKDANLVVNMDMTLTDGFLLYINNLVHGWQNGRRLYPNWPIAVKKVDIVKVAQSVVDKGDIDGALLDIAPKYRGYAKLREKLSEYYKVAANGGWQEIPDGDTLQKDAKGYRVYLLQKRLLISGELDSINKKGKFDATVESAVMAFQENNGLDNDGTVGAATLRALNVPVGDRIRQIELNMDRMRFLPDEYPSDYVLVNVPDYSLIAVESGNIALFSPVVTGKPKRQTCILNSKISMIELNPFWNIPPRIANEEILPELKSDPSFLQDNNITVFKSEGNSRYTTVNVKDINWRKVSAASGSNFRFRQNPGEGNALGKFKFIFANNCSIYLHDSNYPELFDESARGFSHGCIRVGQPMDLALYLLANNKNWDIDKLNSEIDASKHQFIKLNSAIPLYIIYLTAWYDDDSDFVQFRDDIYHFDQARRYPLYLPQQSVKTKNASNPI